MTFLWCPPPKISEEDPTSTTQAISCLNKKQKLYYTRQMRDFLIKYSQFVKAPFCVLRHMFKELVHDTFTAALVVGQNIDDQVSEAIPELQNPDLREIVVNTSQDHFLEKRSLFHRKSSFASNFGHKTHTQQILCNILVIFRSSTLLKPAK